MKKFMVAALGAVLFVGVGCQNDGGSSDDADVTVRTERTDTMRGADDCTMCEGTQTARADGTCPQCGMKVRTANR
jgi:hypothetical protein